MCLTTSNKNGKISGNKPVKCLKVYKVNSEGETVSLFWDSPVKLEKDCEIVAEGEQEITEHYLYAGIYCLGKGFLHGITTTSSYRLLDLMVVDKLPMINALCHGYKEGFKSEVDKVMANIGPNMLICEMEIPAGERYWENGLGDICAKKLIFKRIIVLTRADFLQWLLQWILKTTPEYKGSSKFEEIIGICKEIEPALTFEEK